MSSTPKPRVIVLCFDGTSNRFCAQNTNVVKLYGLLDKSSPLEQLVYYQPGIGTYINPGVVSPALTWLAKILDMGFASYLNEHVMGGYKFLMQNYRAGDKICIFGFSRGAYTARALAGFLFKIGLLPRDNIEQVPFAYDLYTREDNPGLKVAEKFKQTFCIPVTIDFLGVWDTVPSVGLIYRRSLPFTSANSAVKVFRHALSLDERRARFQPNLYHRESPQEAAMRREDPVGESESPGSGAVEERSTRHQHQIPVTQCHRPNNSRTLGTGESSAEPSMTVPSSLEPVLEVWFAGCHADVGGSAVEDTVQSSLADISLQWMVNQVYDAQCGIKFDDGALRAAGIEGLTTTSASLPEGGGGEHLVQQGGNRWVVAKEDVGARVHDELVEKPAWWLLEILPVKYTWQKHDGTWKSKWGINFGKGREIRDSHPIFHESVRQKMENPKYKPRAKWTPGTERYTDGKCTWSVGGRTRASGKFRVGLFALACNLYASMDQSPAQIPPGPSERSYEGTFSPMRLLVTPVVPKAYDFAEVDSVFSWWG